MKLENLGLAVFVGVLAGLSPHTSAHRLIPSLVGGVAAGAVFLGVRERRRSGADADGPGLAASLRAIPPILWACAVAFCVLFAPTFLFLYGHWTFSIWENGHGLFVPALAAWLATRILRREGSPTPEPSRLGFVWLAGGLLLVVLDAGARTGYISTIGLWACLPGISLLLLGEKCTRAIALPLALCFFMIPLPSGFAAWLYLPQATGILTEPLVELFGIPVLRLTSVLILPNDVFAISDRCSGVSAFFAAIAVSVLLVAHTRSRWRKVLLLLAPWPLVVVLSALRCASLIVFAHYYGLGILELATHGLSGIAAFWSVLFVLWLLPERGTVQRAFA